MTTEPRRNKWFWLAGAILALAPFSSHATNDTDTAGEEPAGHLKGDPGGLPRQAPAAFRQADSDSAEPDGQRPPEVSKIEPQSAPSTPIDTALRSTALLFFQALMAGVPEAIVELADYPFNLDGEIVEDRTALGNKLQVTFRTSDLSRLPFYGMRAFPAEQMVERHGSPPRRLEGVDLGDAWVAIANLGGHAYIGIFKKRDGAWRAIAYTE